MIDLRPGRGSGAVGGIIAVVVVVVVVKPLQGEGSPVQNRAWQGTEEAPLRTGMYEYLSSVLSVEYE